MNTMRNTTLDVIFPEALFDYECFEHKGLFANVCYVWEALLLLKDYIATYLPRPRHQKNVEIMQSAIVGPDVVLGADVVIEPHVYIKGPAIVGDRTVIRHCAYVRENVIIGEDCIIGNATEVKHSIVMNGVRAGHWNYIGDSILGFNVNLGAGVKLANSKITDTDIMVRNLDGKIYTTGLRKLGAITGDDTQIGCNAVLNPGTILGKGCLVYPVLSVQGTHFHHEVIKSMRDA
jgi:NDP-sugar pyrophosphorylase family protein